MRGQSYLLTVQGTFGNYQHLRAYLDYNQDGDFNDPGETLLTTSAGSATATISIPATGVVVNAPLRLRIVADSPVGSALATTACMLAGQASDGSGQVEDYTVVVSGPRSVTSIASGDWNAPATWSCNCLPINTDLITIQTGHTVTVSSGLVQASALKLMGRVQYTTGGRLLLTGN